MPHSLALISLLVHEYDEAISFFTNALRFDLVEDTQLDDDKRWVVVAPRDSNGAHLLLAKAASPAQAAQIGNQAGGRVFLFLHTRAFWDDYAHMQANGVRFLEAPRSEEYGTVVVFEDLYGNKWDLMEPK